MLPLVSFVWLLGDSFACWLGISTWSPPKSLAWQNGFRLGYGLTLRNPGLWLLVCNLLPLISVVGLLLVVIVGTLWLVALLLLLLFFPARFSLIGGLRPHLAVRTLFDCCRWECWVTQPVQRTSLWPASWLPPIDKSRGFKSVEVQRVWEVFDERLQFMSRHDALHLDVSLCADDVSGAWLVWSKAAEAALADAFRFSGGRLPSRVWFLAGVAFCFALYGLAVIRFGRLGLILVMLLMLPTFSCTVAKGDIRNKLAWNFIWN